MLQSCRRHPGHLFALSCPGCKQETHDKQYPEYAITRPRPVVAQLPTEADLRVAAVTVAGLAVIVNQPAVVDPAVAYQLSVIAECRPKIASLETRLNRRNWRMDDIGTALLWQLERDRQALHIAEELLLDLYGQQRRSAALA